MNTEDSLIVRLSEAVQADAESALHERSCLTATELWRAVLHSVPWTEPQQRHLESCDRCRTRLDKVRATVAGAGEGPTVVPATAAPKVTPPVVWNVAAASAEPSQSLETAVRDAAAAGAKTLELRLSDDTIVPLFNILVDERMVEPCVVPGRTVIVDLPRLGQHVVTKYGGITISWDDLKTVYVKLANGGKTIEISG
jgi:hypothetical protein